MKDLKILAEHNIPIKTKMPTAFDAVNKPPIKPRVLNLIMCLYARRATSTGETKRGQIFQIADRHSGTAIRQKETRTSAGFLHGAGPCEKVS